MLKTITARHFELSEEMKSKAEAEIEGLKRFFNNIISAELILDSEKHRKKAELKVRVYNQTLAATADTDDIYSSIDSVVEKIKGQLKKYKGKLKDKRPEQITSVVEQLTKPATDDEDIE
ncbi:MAG TPA: ribosome-associated translation inhibitor RaiA [candidate division Zixibacteria bacterium]|nr:ribosome-associated translation inhibitor RaiA [candidate division Zixibacteria bacterium]